MNALGRAAFLVALSSVTSLTVGCAAVEEDAASTESTLIGRVQGSTLGSAYAKPNATYLTVRTVSLLESVDALDQDVSSLAGRVDGIIANQPADGRVSVQELVKIEQPGFIETLFPAEKAALPRLWELLETTAAAPKNPAGLAALPAVAPQDTSTPAGTLTFPTTLAIADLPERLKVAAQRVQLTNDSDNDDATISVADLEAAIATPGPYTPDEVQKFHEIIELFTAHATSSISSRAKVPAPFAKSKTLSALGSAKLRVDDSLALRETRSLSISYDGATRVTLEGVLQRSLHLDAAPGEQVIAISEESENERLIAGQVDGLDAGVTTFEVWAAGKRKSIHRVKFTSGVKSVSDRIDLSKWIDHALSAGSAPLFKNVLTATTTHNSWYNQHYGSSSSTSYYATYEYGLAALPTPAGADATALATLATPLGVTAGRYEVTAGSAGTVRIDVSPTGVVDVTRLATGATIRAYVHNWSEGPKFHASFPDRFRVLLNGKTRQLTIFFDGNSTLFDGTLSADDRKG